MKFLCYCMLAALPSFQQQPAVQATPAQKAVAGKKHALIICGHPGDDEHRQQFSESVARIRAGLTKNYGFQADDISVLFGEERDAGDEPAAEQPAAEKPAEENPPIEKTAKEKETDSTNEDTPDDSADEPSIDMAWLNTSPAATRENLEQRVADLSDRIDEQDSLWVITIGHAHFEKGRSWFNLPGPDMQQNQFAELFEPIRAKQQVFFLTTPVSGYYIKPLSKPGRIIVSATESDLEINGTLYPHALAEVLETAPTELNDFDKDGKFSLFDLHLNIIQNVAQRYLDDMLLATEHAQLDDNGDKRASEIQRHYLAEDLGGLPRSRQRKTLSSKGDGHIARGITLVAKQPKADKPQVEDAKAD